MHVSDVSLSGWSWGRTSLPKDESVRTIRRHSGEVSFSMPYPPFDWLEGSLIPSIFSRPFGRESRGSRVRCLVRENKKFSERVKSMSHYVRTG